MFLSPKSKYIFKDAIAYIENKQGKVTCESIPSENLDIQKKLNQNKIYLVKLEFFRIT